MIVSRIESLEILKFYQTIGIRDILCDKIESFNTIIKPDPNKEKNNTEYSNTKNSDTQNQSYQVRHNTLPTIEELKKEVENFEGCALKKLANNTVFSSGNPKSKILIIGEGPGQQEDLKAVPFCGDSGMLLNNMLNAINVKRDEVYVTNSVFWRPPGNRKPTQEELDICLPFVEKQIAIIKPKLIILMGATAMYNLLRIEGAISNFRGKFIDYENKYLTCSIKTTIMFHPSYLIRQPVKKKLAWEDLLKISKFIENNYEIQ